MATTTTSSATTTVPTAPKSLFPDGLKTSGQHSPTYAHLTPPSLFPKVITGPTGWKAEDYRDHPERWTHVFSASEVEELGKAADEFIGSGRPLTGMAKEYFPLPTLEAFFGSVRREVLNGKGFILFKGLPVQEWGLQKSATA
jgi:hypothetical protein